VIVALMAKGFCLTGFPAQKALTLIAGYFITLKKSRPFPAIIACNPIFGVFDASLTDITDLRICDRE
jgi:dienelactone hydrolase